MEFKLVENTGHDVVLAKLQEVGAGDMTAVKSSKSKGEAYTHLYILIHDSTRLHMQTVHLVVKLRQE